MGEQRKYDSKKEFVLKMVSFNRTRYFAKGDKVLFRPGTHFLAGFRSAYLRLNYWLPGISTFFMHAGVALALMLALMPLIGRNWAFLCGLLFLPQKNGMEIVIWRHISPYGVGAGLFLLGLYFLHRHINRHRSLWPAAAVFFLSTLFHESFFIALFGFGGVCLLVAAVSKFRGRPLSTRAGLSTAVWACFVPAFISLVWNIIDAYLFLHGEINQSLAQHFTVLTYLSWHNVLSGLTVFGIFLRSFIFPYLMHVHDIAPRFNSTVIATDMGLLTVRVLGAVLLAFFVFMGWRLLKKGRRWSGNYPSQVLGLSAFLFLGFSAVSWIRLVNRGIGYVGHSHYYTYLFNIAFWLLLGLLIREIIQSKYRFKKYLLGAIVVVMVSQNIHNVIQIRHRSMWYETAASFHQAVTQGLLDWIKRNPGDCYAGTFDPYFYVWGAPFSVYDAINCNNREGNPVFIGLDEVNLDVHLFHLDVSKVVERFSLTAEEQSVPKLSFAAILKNQKTIDCWADGQCFLTVDRHKLDEAGLIREVRWWRKHWNTIATESQHIYGRPPGPFTVFPPADDASTAQ